MIDMGIQIPQSQLVKPEEKSQGIKLGNVDKTNPLWVAALGWDDLPDGSDVDGDLWLVGLGSDGQAIDLVFYDKDDPTRVVESLQGTGAYRYLGDARSGKQIKGDDEQGIIDHAACHRAGIVRTLVIGNIYKPSVDWGKVPNSYLRIFPEGVSDREGNVLKADKADAIKAVKLNEVANGSQCVVFGVDEFTGPNPLDWTFKPNPSTMPSLKAGLAPFGIEL
jgi:hypothetical protein